MTALFLTPDWPVPATVRALTTLRAGGVSHAPWASLNFGQRTPDEPYALAENLRRLIAAAQLPAAPQWLQQVHGTAVCDLDQDSEQRTADAAVTSRTAVVCAIQTADCLPVLLATSDGSVIAAAHAGWRGLAAGVLQATVQSLRARATRATDIVAWLGPAISPAHYEVGADVREAFLQSDPGAAPGFLANARGRWQCDLYALARRALGAAGVDEVLGGEHCSFAETGRFFSHRRDGHLPGGTGRMATLIWRVPEG
ncbi:MAG: peptidoglycan editing factor PgeF [Pseudomonadota bacterium]